jgi:hypothetical protein
MLVNIFENVPTCFEKVVGPAMAAERPTMVVGEAFRRRRWYERGRTVVAAE